VTVTGTSTSPVLTRSALIVISISQNGGSGCAQCHPL
jgi:hypothetical protein